VFGLIVRSQEVDPRRTPDMAREEEKAREFFEEVRSTLQLFCPKGWVAHFQKHVKTFIQERLSEAAEILAVPGKREGDLVHLHRLRRLIAGSFQEGELVQQPDYAFTSARLDGAIIWDGRG
jgi:hypothetical protein